MNLVIVESPSKAKTIEKYLGKGYKVMSTVGHIIDLPKSKISVDIDNDFEPKWTTIKGKAPVIKKLKAQSDKSDIVYLAMDPDREGEAIAWHTQNALKLKDPKRIVFHEITKKAVNEAIKKPRTVDDNLVSAQIARRVLDRLVGYQVSEVLWKKIWYGLSAGRVQSVALRLIVEREREILAFDPKEYWEMFANIFNSDKKDGVVAKLARKNGKKIVPKDEKEVTAIEKDVKNKEFKVVEIKRREVKKHAYPPFTTSTMQQSAYNGLSFTAKRTMALAQRLYQAGYITYMRTDSVNLAAEAIEKARKQIEIKHGKEYLPEKPNYYKNKSRNAQEAHEAIRPTDFAVPSTKVKEDLGSAEAKLYNLIHSRALASQMNERIAESLSVKIDVKGKSGDVYQFTVGAEKVLFEGFRKVLKTSKKDKGAVQEIEDIKEGEIFDLKEFKNDQKFTKPKARYTDASLVKTLESYGVGRPSTYASIISTVQDRGYVVKDGRNLKPTDVGMVVSDFLLVNFDRLVNYEYTADVENKLDDIAEGSYEYVPFIKAEYAPLVKEIKLADKNVKKEDVVILEDSDEKCPKCKGAMVVRLGRYGRFLSCAKFPECNGILSLDGGEENLDYDKYKKPVECPKDGAKMILKNGKYGQFWACENYPDCKSTLPMLLNQVCPECGSDLVERRSKWGRLFVGCSGYPDCKYIQKKPKAGEEDSADTVKSVKKTTKKKTSKTKATSSKKSTKQNPKKKPAKRKSTKKKSVKK